MKIRWELYKSKVMYKCSLKGTVIECIDEELATTLLLQSALTIVEIAETCSGIPVPLMELPRIKEKNSVYVEFRFNSKKNLENFFETIVTE